MDNLNSAVTERFMVRVYAVIINDQNELLISDELYKGIPMTKFPGGGLEFGEGTLDCLKREAMEEFGQEIEIREHFYTTDFYQASLFHEKTQLISIYYRAEFKEPIRFKVTTRPFDFQNAQQENISFRWISLANATTSDMTFPIDQVVLGLIKNRIRQK